VYAAGVAALPLLETDAQLALGLLLLLPALLIGVYIVTKALLGDRLGGTIIAVMCIFMIAANLRTRAYTDKSIDWQVGMKMVAFTLLMAMAVVFLSYAFTRLHLGRLFYVWLFFFAWVVVASLYSVSVVYALTCSITLLIAYLYAVYTAVWLSRTRALEILMFVALLLCVGSIFVYYANPSMGRMQAWMPGAVFGDTGRMKGLTSSPNAIGATAALLIVVALLYYKSFGAFGKRLAVLLIPIASVCLVLTNSRTSMIAMVVAIWFASVCRSDTMFKLVLSITGVLIGGALLVGFSDEIFAMLSRSGKAVEVTSATGRGSIWPVVVDLWSQRPFFGYGYTSAMTILPLDPRLFELVVHAHSMLLELLFSGGLVLLSIFLYAICRTFLVMYRLRAVREATLLVFFLTRGLVETGPFVGMADYHHIAFTMVIALVISKAIDARDDNKAVAASPFTAPRAGREPRLSRA
jgi:O-antigen ligase